MKIDDNSMEYNNTVKTLKIVKRSKKTAVTSWWKEHWNQRNQITADQPTLARLLSDTDTTEKMDHPFLSRSLSLLVLSHNVTGQKLKNGGGSVAQVCSNLYNEV